VGLAEGLADGLPVHSLKEDNEEHRAQEPAEQQAPRPLAQWNKAFRIMYLNGRAALYYTAAGRVKPEKTEPAARPVAFPLVSGTALEAGTDC
jgi:hypothetical protein